MLVGLLGSTRMAAQNTPADRAAFQRQDQIRLAAAEGSDERAVATRAAADLATRVAFDLFVEQDATGAGEWLTTSRNLRADAYRRWCTLLDASLAAILADVDALETTDAGSLNRLQHAFVEAGHSNARNLLAQQTMSLEKGCGHDRHRQPKGL